MRKKIDASHPSRSKIILEHYRYISPYLHTKATAVIEKSVQPAPGVEQSATGLRHVSVLPSKHVLKG